MIKVESDDLSDDENDLTLGNDDSGFLQNKEFFQQINQIQDTFYAANKKNKIFKKSQKEELAKYICGQLDVNFLLSKMIYIGNANNIYFDYLIFKMFANNTNYNIIIEYYIQLFSDIIVKFGTFIIHVNLKTITVSAVERHKDFVRLFTQQCLSDGRHEYSLCLDMCYIYNSPTLIDMIKLILKGLIEPVVMQKIHII